MPEIAGANTRTFNDGMGGLDGQRSWRDKVQAKKDELSRRLEQDMQAVDLSRDSGNDTMLDANKFKGSQREQTAHDQGPRRPIFTLETDTTNRFFYRSQNTRVAERLKDVSPVEVNRVSFKTQDSEKSYTGSAFNFDELISKRLKQRKKCREAVMDQLMND